MGLIGRVIGCIFGDDPEEETRRLIDRVNKDIKFQFDMERMQRRNQELHDKVNYLRGYNAAMAENRPAIDEPIDELEVVE